MKAVYFDEVNVEIAKDQKEYNTLPAHVTKEGVVVTCFELDDKEIEMIRKEKKIWMHQLTFNRGLQPFNIFALKNYFDSVRIVDGGFIVLDEQEAEDVINDTLNKVNTADGRLMRLILRNGKDLLPEGWGLTVLAYPFGSTGLANYISDVDRDVMINMLRETADKLEAGNDFPTPESN